jgi:hypothetical protein
VHFRSSMMGRSACATATCAPFAKRIVAAGNDTFAGPEGIPDVFSIPALSYSAATRRSVFQAPTGARFSPRFSRSVFAV